MVYYVFETSLKISETAFLHLFWQKSQFLKILIFESVVIDFIFLCIEHLRLFIMKNCWSCYSTCVWTEILIFQDSDAAFTDLIFLKTCYCLDILYKWNQLWTSLCKLSFANTKKCSNSFLGCTWAELLHWWIFVLKT